MGCDTYLSDTLHIRQINTCMLMLSTGCLRIVTQNNTSTSIKVPLYKSTLRKFYGLNSGLV